MKGFFRTHKIETSIFAFALVLRLAMFFILLALSSPEGFSFPLAGSDSRSYLESADELRASGRFFDRNTGLPNSYETPGYPLFLAFIEKLGGGPLGAVVVQDIIAAVSAVVVYKIGVLISPGVGLGAALLFALDPTGVFYSNFILTETLFIFLVLAAVYFLFESLLGSSISKSAFSAGEYRRPTSIWRGLFTAGALLGTAAMVRPVGEIFLPGFLAVLFLFYFKEWRKIAFAAVTVLLGFLLIAGPWFLRNKILFDRWELSSVASIQFAFAHAPLFYAYKNNIPPREAITLFVEKVKSISPYGAEATLRNSPYLWQVALEYLSEDPFGFAKFHAVKTIPFFFSDGWREMVGRAGVLPNATVNISDFLLRGDISGLKEALFANKRAFALFAGGSLFWFLVNGFMILGILFAFKAGKIARAILFLSTFIVFAAAVVAGGAVSHPRYRLSISPFMFLLAAFGFSGSVAFLKSRWLNKSV